MDNDFRRRMFRHQWRKLPAAKRHLGRWSVGAVKKCKCESMDAEL
jgi:hypothetical protein